MIPGIELSEDALNSFLRAKSASDSLLNSSAQSTLAFSEKDKLRWLKVRILSDREPPVMNLVETHPLTSSIADDYNALGTSLKESPLSPCYFFFRLDSTSNSDQNYEWLLIW